MRGGDVREHLVVDASASRAHRVDRESVVLGCPGHHGVGDQGQAPRLLGLGFEVAGADGALMGVEQVPLQRVQRLALVELPGDLAPVRRVGQVAGRVDRASQSSVFLERRGQGVLPAGG